jgi:hypothetical protein
VLDNSNAIFEQEQFANRGETVIFVELVDGYLSMAKRKAV